MATHRFILWHVLPRLARRDVVDVERVYPIVSGDGAGHLTAESAAANLDHIGAGQLRHGVSLTSRSASLCYAIVGVIPVSSAKQMCWIAAGRIVASVKHHVCRPLTIGHKPHGRRSASFSAFLARLPDSATPIMGHVFSSPDPAFVWPSSIDVFPNALRKHLPLACIRTLAAAIDIGIVWVLRQKILPTTPASEGLLAHVNAFHSSVHFSMKGL